MKLFDKKKNNTKTIYLVTDNGIKLMEVNAAISNASNVGMKLVEVSTKDGLPLCKVADWGRIQYLAQKKKTVKHKPVKEITIKSNIGEHDLKRKLSNMSNFTKKGHDVVVKIMCKRGITNKQEVVNRLVSMMPQNQIVHKQKVNNSITSVRLRSKQNE